MSVEQQLAEALRAHRGERSQTDVAQAMRDLGFRWTQSTLAAVESTSRPRRVSLHELAGLCSVYRVGIRALLPDLAPALMYGAPLLEQSPCGWLDEVDLHAARRISLTLGRPVTPAVVRGAALRMWQCSIREKRDQCLPHSTARGERGHVTRRLIAQLTAELSGQV